MTNMPINLHELRRRIYAKAKAEKALDGTGGVKIGCTIRKSDTSNLESAAVPIGLINLGAKLAGKPGAGKLHAGFDVAGVGNAVMVEM